MKARPSFLLLLAGGLLALLLAAGGPAGRARAQANPTPIVIDLTPTPTATATAGPAGVAPDGLEPNDSAAAATAVGLGMLLDLTLTEDDVDYFTGYVKAGQHLEISTWVDASLDTRLTLFWQETLLATNDDRSPTDLGSTVTFTVPADGAYLVLIERAGALAGGYALEVALVPPTPTQTPAPTASPTATPTPLLPPDIAEPNNDAGSAFAIVPGARYQLTVGHGDVDLFRFLGKAGNRYSCQTVTTQVDTVLEIQGSAGQLGANDDRGLGRVDSYAEFAVAADQTILVTVTALGGSFGPYEFGCDFAAPAPPAGSGATAGGGSPMATPTLALPAGSQPTISATMPLSTSHLIPLTVRPLADDRAHSNAATTAVRLLIYYDANNDRQAGPGEGVPNVSVVAVDSTGQPVARLFTNGAGEVVFNLPGDVARIMVPFVSGWSTPVRTGQVNEEIQLGLPAVVIPRFFPVEAPAAE